MQALLVEHGCNRGALTAARALRRAGWTIDVISSGHTFTGRSASVRRHEHIRYPEGGPDALVGEVREMIRRCATDIVFPVDETQLLILSHRRQELGALLPYPAHDVVMRATDRLVQARIAERTGLAPPGTRDLATRPAGASERFVVKSRRPALIDRSGHWSRFETRIGTGGAAAGWVAELSEAGASPMVQEVLEGRLACLSVLTSRHGVSLAATQQTAVRIWPQHAGTSARAVTVPVDPELHKRAMDFLGALEWRGFAQLQFILDRLGVHHLVDFNPRFYGSLALAIGSGVDFPRLWAASAMSDAPPAPATGRPGVRYAWMGGDLRRAVRERRGGMIADVASSLRWGLPAVHPVWSYRDPWPAVDSAIATVRPRLPRRA